MSKYAPPYPNAATDPFNKVPGMNKPSATSTPDVKLLPCPCGAPAKIYPTGSAMGPKAKLVASCDDPECQWSMIGYGPEQVAERWNRQTNTAAKDAEIEALRAEVERLQKIVRPKREEDCLTLDHWRMRAYDLEANWSRCSRACAGEQDKREQAEARAERLAEALREIERRMPQDQAGPAWIARTLAREAITTEQENDDA